MVFVCGLISGLNGRNKRPFEAFIKPNAKVFLKVDILFYQKFIYSCIFIYLTKPENLKCNFNSFPIVINKP